MLAFQRIQPRLIWSSKALGIGKYMRKGQVAAPANRFNEIDKMGKFSYDRGRTWFPSH